MKAFEFIPQSLFIAKLQAYGLYEKALSYIYSYLTNRNECVAINDTKHDFQNISSVPQDSITEPNLFNFSTNNLFIFVRVHQCTNLPMTILYMLLLKLLRN